MPAGADETGIVTVLPFGAGRRETPSEMSFGVGESGAEKGCAEEVEVAEGKFGRGELVLVGAAAGRKAW